MIDYFAHLNQMLPNQYNPADFFLDVSQIDSRSPLLHFCFHSQLRAHPLVLFFCRTNDAEEFTKTRLKSLIQAFKEMQKNPEKFKAEHKVQVPKDPRSIGRGLNAKRSVAVDNRMLVDQQPVNPIDWLTKLKAPAVIDWLKQKEVIDDEEANLLKKHKMSGRALMLFAREQLEKLGIAAGPAAVIEEEVRLLKQKGEEEKRLEQRFAPNADETITSEMVIKDETIHTRAPFLSALFLLMSRSWNNFIRQPWLLNTRLNYANFIAYLIILFALRLSSDQTFELASSFFFFSFFSLPLIFVVVFCASNASVGSIQSRFGVIQLLSFALFSGMYTSITTFPKERNVFYMERQDGVYSVLPFFLSYTIIEAIIEFVTAFLFSICIVFIVGMGTTFDVFMVYVYAIFCTLNVGESFAMILSAFSFEPGFHCFFCFPPWLSPLGLTASSAASRNVLPSCAVHADVHHADDRPDVAPNARCHQRDQLDVYSQAQLVRHGFLRL